MASNNMAAHFGDDNWLVCIITCFEATSTGMNTPKHTASNSVVGVCEKKVMLTIKMIMLIMISLDPMAPPGPVSKCWLQKMAKKPHENRNFRTKHVIFAIKIFHVTYIVYDFEITSTVINMPK